VSTAPVWTQVTTAIVAALGFVLSLFNMYLRWRDNRTRLRIEESAGVHTWMTDTPLLVFNVANAGKVPITVSSIHLALRGDRNLWLPHLRSGHEGKHIPCRLEPGEPAPFFHEMAEIARTLVEEGYRGTVRAKVVVQDGLGKKHKKRIKILGVEDWARG
jgi:hypothetical protein